MIKKLFVSLFFVFGVFALTDVTIPYSFAPLQQISASKFNANFDTLGISFNRLLDSLEQKYLRVSAVKDSNWQKIKTDSIRSNPNVDSLKGNIVITGETIQDSLKALTKIRIGNGGPHTTTILTDSMRTWILSSDSAKIRSVVVDSIKNNSDIAWHNYVDSSTIIGFVSFTYKQMYYSKKNGIVNCALYFEGTSNDTVTTFTLPVMPDTNAYFGSLYDAGGEFGLSGPPMGVGIGTDTGAALIYVGYHKTQNKFYLLTGLLAQIKWNGTGYRNAAVTFWYKAK